MPLKIQCPSCGARYTAPDGAAYKTVTCAKCSSTFCVPPPKPPPPSPVEDVEFVADDLVGQPFLMSRGKFQPQDFGVDMSKDDFLDLMTNEFGDFTKSNLSLDELLLRPSTALVFVNNVRAKHGFYDVPEDIILRSVMIRRKNPRPLA